MIPIQLCPRFFFFKKKKQRIVRGKLIWDFVLGVRMFEGFSASSELIWFCMDNFEPSESPGLAQPLHI